MTFRLLVITALIAFPAGASAARRPLPPISCGEFACPPHPSPPAVPDPAALDAARRIVHALDMDVVGLRTAELRALAVARAGPERPRPRSGRIEARPAADLAAIPYWSYELQERVVDHAALYYLGAYSPAELAEMATFVEGTAGRRLMADSQPRSAEVTHVLTMGVLEGDLWDIVCGIPPRREPEDGIHYRFDLYHRSLEGFERPRAAPWCADVESELTGQPRSNEAARDNGAITG